MRPKKKNADITPKEELSKLDKQVNTYIQIP